MHRFFKNKEMRSFASDNNSGVHPLILDAVMEANDDHAVGYGDDPWTARATKKIQEVFGEAAQPFFVFNGTGANSVALERGLIRWRCKPLRVRLIAFCVPRRRIFL